MDFLERLSYILGKQYLFKEDSNPLEERHYYNRWTSSLQTAKEAEDWLLEKIEECVEKE